MLTFKKRLATIIFLLAFSAAAIISCGKQAGKEETTTEQPAGEHPSDSTEHPSDSTEHPTEHPSEHPTDSVKN
jgi:hypothetical protein